MANRAGDNPFSPGTSKILRDESKKQTSERSSGRLKIIFIILGTIIGLLAISTAVLALMLNSKIKEKDSSVTDNVCGTPYCVKAANYLLESIDESVEPCEDFFQFVCGTWIKNTRIPDDAGSANTFNALRVQLDYNIVDLLSASQKNATSEPRAISNARLLYQTCLNEDQIEAEDVTPILSLINQELGGWPILQGTQWNNASFNLLNLLVTLRTYSNNVIFAMGTSTDEKNSTEYDIEIGQGDLALGQREYYLNETKITSAYRQLITDLAKTLSNDSSTIDQDVNDMFEFEKQMSIYHLSTAEQRARQNESIRTTVGNLPTVLNTNFNFSYYITRVYASANVTLTADDILTVDEIGYLYNMSSLIDRTPARVLQNYAVWRFLLRRMDDMPKRVRTLKEKFDRIFRGTSAEQPRTTICGSFTNTNMGFAVSWLYIRQYFDRTARNQSFELIGNVRRAFIEMLEQSTWMDDVSKTRAIEKAQAIDEKIGYPDYLEANDASDLEKQYAEYVFGTSYINNVLKLLQIKSRESLHALRKTVNRKAWGSSPPTVVNAFYTPSKNQITFPAGILQMPFFDKDAPKYLNYGAIGVVIGHEITHGFDDNGRQFDKNGNRIPWWTDETIAKFIERKTCIVNQYSNFTVPNLNIKSNGNQTQGEDIADNGGLRESFFAYRKWTQTNNIVEKRLPGLVKYSPEQMFFINYAHTWCTKMTDAYALNRVLSDVHSLGQFRVMGPTSNFDEFDRAFGCKPGQGNSRVNKCIVW